MRRCNESNPENPEDHCIQPEGRHSQHYGRVGVMWPNARVIEEIARAPKRRPGGGRNNSAASPGAKKRIRDIAAGAEPERHVNPAADGRFSKESGKAAADQSESSRSDRLTFFLATAELATQRESFTTNEVHELLRSRGWIMGPNANYVGNAGDMGVRVGFLERLTAKVLNTSGLGHSNDNGVAKYRSKVVGQEYGPLAVRVIEDDQRPR